MWSGPKRFDVLLDRPDHTFAPGEIVAGRVAVDLVKPKNLRSLKVRVKGKAKVFWKHSRGSGRKRRTTHYSGSEVYFRTDLYMLGEPGNGETIEMATGSHVFPFEFILPINIPSSFETTHATVRYTVKAIMDRPWKFDHKTTVTFPVETPHELTRCSLGMGAINDDEYKSLCCFPLCYNVGVARYNIFLPTNGFTIGEAIQARINIDTTSTRVEVTKVTLELEQVLRLHATSPWEKTKTETSVVQKVKEYRDFGKTDEVQLFMQVPSVPYSDFVHCSIIDIEYFLKVIIAFSGCHCSMKRKYPVAIGSIAATSFESAGNSTVIPTAMPTAPFFPGESDASAPDFPRPAVPNVLMPIGFVTPSPGPANFSGEAPERPPPSYEQVMGINEKQ